MDEEEIKNMTKRTRKGSFEAFEEVKEPFCNNFKYRVKNLTRCQCLKVTLFVLLLGGAITASVLWFHAYILL